METRSKTKAGPEAGPNVGAGNRGATNVANLDNGRVGAESIVAFATSAANAILSDPEPHGQVLKSLRLGSRTLSGKSFLNRLLILDTKTGNSAVSYGPKGVRRGLTLSGRY